MRRWLFLGALALVATGGSATSTGCGELELPGTLADAGGANARCGVGEDCVLPPPCSGPERFMYVSAKGDDKNDGCSPAKPKATIKSAVTAITKARAGFQADGGVLPWEVHVCAGTYKESQLVVEYPLSIRGGYDCASFKRDDNFGYAKGFKSANETILQNGAYSPEYNSPLTFLLRRQDTKITRTDTIIDGLTIDAGEGNSGTVGVTVTDGASPTLSDNKIKGGSGFCSSTFGSMGIWVIDGSPLIKNNDIYGGDGKCYEPDTPENARKGRGAGNGSYGMLLQGGGDVEVVENVVNGGSGTGADATTAISVASAGKRDIRNNFITWDKPRMEASGYNGGIGVAAVGDTELSIVGNVIKGGIASCFETCLIWGILAAETARIRVDHSEDALIFNNMVFSGGLYSDTVSPASMAGFNVEGKKGFYNERNATALMFDDRGHGGRAINNTLFTVSGDPVSPPTENSQKGGKGWDVVRPYYLAIGYTGAILQNNLSLMIGNTGNGQFGFTLVEADEALGLVENNAFVNYTGPAVLMIHTNAKDGAPRPNDVYTTLEDMVAANWYKPEQIRNNVFIQADCKTIPAALCVKEASANGSFGALLPYMEGATEEDFGTKKLFETGWKLTSGAHCRVRAGAPINPTAPNDFFGTARTAPASFGAHEADSAGCP